MKEIIKIRLKEEKIEMTEDAFNMLLDLAEKNSLRYAIILMGPIKEITLRNGRTKATLEDVEEASKLFIDYRTSMSILKEYEKLYLK